MRKIWVIPAAVLLVLIVSGFFRYEEVASKTTDTVVYKWKVDRWTQAAWQEEYYTRGSSVKVKYLQPKSGSPADAEHAKKSMTSAWHSAMIIASLWLIVGIAWPKSKQERRSSIDA